MKAIRLYMAVSLIFARDHVFSKNSGWVRAVNISSRHYSKIRGSREDYHKLFSIAFKVHMF